MKTLKSKTMVAAIVAAAIALGGIPGITNAQTGSSSAKSLQNFRQQKVAINSDLAKVSQQKKKVEALEDKCKADRKAGEKPSASKEDWQKAKADLKREKAYLRADKKELMQKHQAHIRSHNKEVHEQRAGLTAAYFKLLPDLAKGKATAVEKTESIVNAKHQLKMQKVFARSAKLNRNADLLAINKEVREADGQSPFVLAFEDGAAKTQNLVLK